MSEKLPKSISEEIAEPDDIDNSISRREFMQQAIKGAILLTMGKLPAAEAATNIEIKINNSTAEIEYNSNRIKMYKRGEKIAYQIIKKRRDSSVPVPIKEINFQNRSDFSLKISPVLNEAFGSRRPNMSNEMSRVFDAFFGNGENENSRENTRNDNHEQNNETENWRQYVEIIDGNNAKIKRIYRNQGIILKKLSISKGVEISSDTRNRVLYFSSEQDLLRKVGDWLNENIATMRNGRRNIRDEIKYIYDELQLSQNIGRREARESQEVFHNKTFLNLDYGTYTISHQSSNPPATYLLVKNENTGSLYCLSLVQVAFDMIHGSGSARKIGLYSDTWASNLRFREEIDYNSSQHRNLPKGTIIRFDGLGHIGISLGGDKIAHIIGDQFYIDHSDSITDSGYQPARVIIPNESYEAKEIEIRKINSGQDNLGRLEKGRNIENIAYRVQQMISSQNERNLNYIREAIFQLNKDKFKVVHGNGNSDTIVVLKNNYSIINIPSEWLNSR